MSHTRASKGALLARVRRIRGQVEAIEGALSQEQECAQVLQLIAATRGAINGLMNEVIQGHVRCHVVNSKSTAAHRQAAEELLAVVRTYLK